MYLDMILNGVGLKRIPEIFWPIPFLTLMKQWLI
jgi:hypothetical protein